MAFTNPKRMYDAETGQSGGEDGLALRGTIRYAAPGKTITAARQVLQSKNVVDDNDNDLGYTAGYFTQHPEEPGMLLILYRASEHIRIDGVDGWLFDAEYAIPSLGPFTEPPDNSTSPEYYKFSIGFDEVDFPIPIVRKRRIATASNVIPGPPVVLVDTWDRTDESYKVQAISIKLTFNVKAASFSPAMYQAVRAQAGKLHRFGGGGLSNAGDLWLFKQPTFDRVALEIMQVTYTWVSEPGNPNIPGVLQDGSTYAEPDEGPPSPTPPADAATIALPARGPFQEYAVINGEPSIENPGPAPAILAIGPRRQIIPTGHLSLPLIDANSEFPL